MITLAQSALAKRKAGGSGMSAGEGRGGSRGHNDRGGQTLRQRPRCKHRDGITDTESCAFFQDEGGMGLHQQNALGKFRQSSMALSYFRD